MFLTKNLRAQCLTKEIHLKTQEEKKRNNFGTKKKNTPDIKKSGIFPNSFYKNSKMLILSLTNIFTKNESYIKKKTLNIKSKNKIMSRGIYKKIKVLTEFYGKGLQHLCKLSYNFSSSLCLVFAIMEYFRKLNFPTKIIHFIGFQMYYTEF